MTPCDFVRRQPRVRRYFHVQRFSFAHMGVNILSLEQPITSHSKFSLMLLSQFFYCLLMLLYIVDNINDVDEATDSLSRIWQPIISICKLIYFRLHSKKIITVIHKLWLWNSEAKGEEHAIVVAENRKDVIFCSYYHLAVVIVGLTALTGPFATAGFYAWHGESFWGHLEEPAKAAYVIDKKSILGYTIVYIWNICAVYSTIYSSISADSLFFWFTCNIVAHFRILKFRLRQAGDQNNGSGSAKRICECISYHCRTLELANDFNEAFRVIVFLILAISCLQIGCVAFKLAQGDGLINFVFYGFLLIAVSTQLLLYCYGGQRIENESESIAKEIYESFHWESLTISDKKMLILAMRRSQVPCKVSSILFTANMNLFLSVYRNAASFVTLLRTMDDK